MIILLLFVLPLLWTPPPHLPSEPWARKGNAPRATSTAPEGFKAFVGRWQVALLHWRQPGENPLAGSAVARTDLRLNRNYLLTEVHGTLEGEPFEGLLIQSHPGRKDPCRAIWLSSSSPHPTLFQGREEGSEISWTSPPPPEPSSTRGRTVWLTADEFLFQQFRHLPDGSEFKILECRFTRAPLAPSEVLAAPTP